MPPDPPPTFKLKFPGELASTLKRQTVNLKKMKIKEILDIGANLTISVGINDLVEWHKEVIADTRRELEEVVISEKAETYPSPKQVSQILGVDNSTLWRWKNKGYLVPIEVGGKRRYRMSDIKKILDGGKQALQNKK